VAEDINDFIRWVRSQGWRVERDNQGYWRFYRPDGVVAVRAHGIVWPKPSKKEQRSLRGGKGS
jgi:hypothetical protein